MKLSLIVASMLAIAGPAAASCVPQPGLSLQQWYAVCGRDAEYGYSLGGANRPSHDAWIRQVYQMYQSSRPTYNPVLQQQQTDLRNRMAAGQASYMGQVYANGDRINRNFAAQQLAKDQMHDDQMNYINNTHRVCDNYGRCYIVSN